MKKVLSAFVIAALSFGMLGCSSEVNVNEWGAQGRSDTQIVYLCLDNDDAGHKASERMAEQLRERGVMTERLVPELKDWNEDLLHTQKEELAPCLSL